MQVCRAVAVGHGRQRRMLLSSAERKTTGEEGLEKLERAGLWKRKAQRDCARRDTQRFRAVDRRLMWRLSPGQEVESGVGSGRK